MKPNFGDDLIESLEQAAAHSTGQFKAAQVRTAQVQVPDVRSLREKLKMSQRVLCSTYRIPLATLKDWEQGRRQPDATAAAYLSVIEKMPTQARAALES